MRILLIEDDEEKGRAIIDFLMDEYESIVFDVARSFSSGLKSLAKGVGVYDCILLDMSMPNYDITPDEPVGGTPEGFAGIELLAQMKLRGINIPTIVVTMFDMFGDESNRVSLQQLIERLSEQYKPIFRGLTFYNLAENGWKASLKRQIDGVFFE